MGFSAHFWCVQPTSKTSEANCEFRIVSKSKEEGFPHSGSYNIVVLANFRALEVGETLRFLEASSSSKYPSAAKLKKLKL